MVYSNVKLLWTAHDKERRIELVPKVQCILIRERSRGIFFT